MKRNQKKQKKQKEWHHQWSKLYDNSLFLFKEWICPNKIEDFKGKTVLDCGCGGGQHINFIAPYAKKVVGVDLNTIDLAKKNNAGHKNVVFIEDDIAKMNLKEKFDILYCIGVLQHTDNPTSTFNNIKKFLKKNGKLIIWCYSFEGNFLNRTLLEYLKKIIFLRLKKKTIENISHITTALMYLPIYTLYKLPIFKFLPFYYYFKNWRKLTFKRNYLNIFDKLNAPQTIFIKEETVKKWFNSKEFKNIHINHYNGISWRASGTKLE